MLPVHSANVFHGDLSGVRHRPICVFICTDSSPQSNILIDGSGRALLSDFGLSVVLVELEGSPFLTSSMGGTIRYAAPEIYIRQDGDVSRSVRISACSDVYSFGGVTYQVSELCRPLSDVVDIFLLPRHFLVWFHTTRFRVTAWSCGRCSGAVVLADLRTLGSQTITGRL
jgi:serine/threonine protein kinase